MKIKNNTPHGKRVHILTPLKNKNFPKKINFSLNPQQNVNRFLMNKKLYKKPDDDDDDFQVPFYPKKVQQPDFEKRKAAEVVGYSLTGIKDNSRNLAEILVV